MKWGGGSSSGGGSNWTPTGGYAWAGPILFQWGTECVPYSTGVNVTLPITFPNAIMNAVATTDTAHHSASRTNHYVDAIDNSTILVGKAGVDGCVNWLAFGH